MGIPENMEFQLTLSRKGGGVTYCLFAPGSCYRGQIRGLTGKPGSQDGIDLADNLMRSHGVVGNATTVLRSSDLDIYERARAIELIEWIGRNREVSGVFQDDLLVR